MCFQGGKVFKSREHNGDNVNCCNLLPCYLQHLIIKCEADLGTMVEETKKNSMISRPHIESSHIERSTVVLYRVSIGTCLDISTKSTARNLS